MLKKRIKNLSDSEVGNSLKTFKLCC